MKTLLMTGLLLAFAMAAVAAQDEIVVKATMTKYAGTVSNITEKGIYIVVKGNVRYYPWEALDTATVKRYNPEMYAQLRAQQQKEFEEQKRKLGLVPYKGKWMTPKQKEEAEMRDKGLAKYEGKWIATNEVEQLEFAKRMKASGRTEYKGKWYTDAELKDYKEAEGNKGLKVGMTEAEVKAAWGEPTTTKKSQEFSARKRVCWFYVHKDQGTEDRVIFEMGVVKEMATNQAISSNDE